MSRYIPNFLEIEACNFVPFDRESYIAGEIEDGETMEFAVAAADRMERKHNENEKIRVKLAIEKCDKIRKFGRKYADSVWFTTYRA